MSKIGELEEVENNHEKEYWGHIRTLTLNLNIRLTPNKDFRSNPNSPDFLIMGKLGGGIETQIGSAWLKIPNNPTSMVSEFLSLTVDDPSMSTPLNVAAFPKGNKKWDITFRRRKAGSADAA